MQLGEILVTNKAKYTKAYLLENDKETNGPVFTQVTDSTLDPNRVYQDVKDYFLLEKEGFEEIFGPQENIDITEDDKLLIIGV